MRPWVDYEQSLHLHKRTAAAPSKKKLTIKSGLMLGLGETREEVLKVMEDLIDANVAILTLGQYLRPSPQHNPLVEYIHPDTFAFLAEKGNTLGFKQVVADPLVRSSHHAAESFAAASI